MKYIYLTKLYIKIRITCINTLRENHLLKMIMFVKQAYTISSETLSFKSAKNIASVKLNFIVENMHIPFSNCIFLNTVSSF